MKNLAAGSASAAPQPCSILQKQPAVTSTGGYNGWALLDPWILKEDPAANCTGLAVGTTTDDQLIRVSLRLAEPPSSSYVQLHTDARVQVEPTLYAADGDLLLFHMAISVVREYPFHSTEHNLFVYKAHPNPEMGWLRLLPQFADGDAPVRYTGIACRGKDYVVAGLRAKTVARKEGATWDMGERQFMEVGELSRFSSSTDRWEIIDLPMPYNPEQGLYKFVWESDDMFALDGVMFWVDYHRGMLLCDVFAESPSLQFIKLPGIHVWDENHDYSQGRQLPRAYRSVGVSRGQIKFVDIDDGLFGTRKTSGFTITTWSLNITDFIWLKDTVVEVDELWLLPEFCDVPLPRCVPEYPVLSKEDSNILHCILRRSRSDAKTWMVSLDLGKKVLKSYTPFISEQKLDSEEFDLDARNIFCDTPFICYDFGCVNKTPVELSGTPEQISKTKQFFNEVLAEADAGSSDGWRYNTPQPGAEQFQKQIVNSKVGLVIGKGGETIKLMQAKSGSQIKVVPLHLSPGDLSTERTGSIDMKSGITVISASETKKRKSSSSNQDFLELCDSSDDDDVFSDAYDSDSSLETPASRAMHSLSLYFFEVLRTMPLEEINDPTRQWHCPVCRNYPGAIVWYKGLNALMDHARTEATQRVEFHKKLLTLLEYKTRPKLVCHETIDQKRHDLKVKMAMDLLKLPLKGHTTRGARDPKDNMAQGTLWMGSRACQMDFNVQTVAGF